MPLQWSLSLDMKYLGKKWGWVGSICGSQRQIGERRMLSRQKQCQRLIYKGKIKGHPLKAMPKDWESVFKGVEVLKNRGMSGQKIVVFVG